jgi:hypothetical protein
MPFEQAGGVGKGLRERRLGLFADDDLTFFLVSALARARLEINRGMLDTFSCLSSNQAQPISAERVAESLQHSWQWSLVWSLRGSVTCMHGEKGQPGVEARVFLQGPRCFLL